MIRTSAPLAAALFAACFAPVAVAQTPTVPPPPPASLWTASVAPGVATYQTGSFDQAIDGGLRIVCKGGGASLSVQIKGVAPAGGQKLLLVANTRPGSQSFALTTGADGAVAFPHARPGQFRKLWAALRGGDTVTIRYPDDSFTVQSLVGARTTLPARPCV